MTIYKVHDGGGALRHFRFLKSVASYYAIPYQPLAKAMREREVEMVHHKGLLIWKDEVITK